MEKQRFQIFICKIATMSLIQSAAYGFIQGLTEFLPVSSSAHLTLLPFFTGWKDPGLAFDVALHLGTLIALFAYFWRDIVAITIDFVFFLRGEKGAQNVFPFKILVATIPGAIIGLLLEKQAESTFRSPALIASTLIGAGLLLLWAQKKNGNTLINDITWTQAILIGISQGLAIVPGISRSGVTISTALLLGIEKSAAVRFSFYLSMPIIFGAGVLKIKYLAHNLGDPALTVGVLVSAISGFFAIHFLITHVRNKSFTPFVVYRFILATIVFVFVAMHLGYTTAY